MKILGYPCTWVTHCFLDDGCGASVFAHTNGDGDFVLFDDLGPPWPVHDCYANRISVTWASEVGDSLHPSAFDEILVRVRARRSVDEIPAARLEKVTVERYEAELPIGPPDIEPVTAVDYLSKGEFQISGYVQDIVENVLSVQLDKLKRKLGAAGDLVRSQLARLLGNRRTQITVVDGRLQSFTIFADTSQVPIAKKDGVVLTLRAEKSPLPQRSGRHHDIRLLWPFFVCVDIQRMPRLKSKQR